MDFLRRLGAAIDQDYIPWKTLIITFSVAEYALESYLTYRQYQILKSQRIPAQLKNEIDQKTHDKSQAYGRAKAQFGVVNGAFNQLKNLALITYDFYPAWWAVSGLLVNRFFPARFGGEITRSLVFAFSYSWVETIIGLPFSWYHHFVLEEKFGFNKQTVGLWITDMIKGQALSLVFGIPIGAAFFKIIQKTGDNVCFAISGKEVVFHVLTLRLVLPLHLGLHAPGPTPRNHNLPQRNRPDVQQIDSSPSR